MAIFPIAWRRIAIEKNGETLREFCRVYGWIVARDEGGECNQNWCNLVAMGFHASFQKMFCASPVARHASGREIKGRSRSAAMSPHVRCGEPVGGHRRRRVVRGC